jgi:predicted nucleic acid-binding protein
MILVDTSVLIDYLAGNDTRATAVLDEVVQEEALFYVTPLIVQEVLQGSRDEATWQKLRTYLTSLLWVEPEDPMASHVEAARIYFDCRRRGLTVRSSADCLVAQIALEHGLALLHSDRDYESIARVRTRLALLPDD